MRQFFNFYGGTKTTSSEGRMHEWEWERRGQTKVLFMEVLKTVGKQAFALAMINFQVHYCHEFLMPCDSRTMGYMAATACNYTKAYVLCFPLLAVVVIWIVSSRMMLCLRLYYDFLKQQAILDFDPLSPMSDPLYLMLLWCFFNAMAHFPLQIFIEENRPDQVLREVLHIIGSEKLREEMHKVAFFYVCPSVVFLVFLYAAYDTEAMLLPLSKYFEEDPALARDMLSEVEFIPEEVAAHVVKKKKLHFKDEDGNSLTGSEVVAELIDICKLIGAQGAMLLRRGRSGRLLTKNTYKSLAPDKLMSLKSFRPQDPDTSSAESSAPEGSGTLPLPKWLQEARQVRFAAEDKDAALESAMERATSTHAARTHADELHRANSGEIKERFSHWRLISEMWPGRVLLDYRLCDENSKSFRFWWGIWSGVAFLSMVVVFGIFVYMIVVSRPLWESRDPTQRFQFVFSGVVFLHCAVTLALSGAFLKHTMLPQFKTHKV